MTDAAEHLAASLRNRAAGILLQRMAERIIGGDKEPAVAAIAYNRVSDSN